MSISIGFSEISISILRVFLSERVFHFRLVFERFPARESSMPRLPFIGLPIRSWRCFYHVRACLKMTACSIFWDILFIFNVGVTCHHFEEFQTNSFWNFCDYWMVLWQQNDCICVSRNIGLWCCFEWSMFGLKETYIATSLLNPNRLFEPHIC